MNYDALKEAVCAANIALVDAGLVLLTWGNASAVDRKAGVLAIKPSGVAYDALTPETVPIVSIETGEVVEGAMRPSSDTPTHRVLYQRFPGINGLVHTHSSYATASAQAGVEIPCLGTTHADHFYGAVPVTRGLSAEEIEADYEANTGHVIAERFEQGGIDPLHVPGVLVRSHGPFTWGPSVESAVENAIVLEELARTLVYTRALNPEVEPVPQPLLDKHFLRKHGPGAYYGQEGKGQS